MNHALLLTIIAICNIPLISAFPRVKKADPDHALACDLFKKMFFPPTSNVEDYISNVNLFFSPISIRQVLSILMLGSNEKTLKQLTSLLLRQNLTHPERSIFLLSQRLKSSLASHPPSIAIENQNGIFVDAKMSLKSDFKANVHRYFPAIVQNLNISQDPKAAETKINEIVSNATRNKITTILPSGVLTPDTRMVVTNSIYFNGIWANQFNKSETKMGTFNTEKNENQSMLFMNSRRRMPYVREEIDINGTPKEIQIGKLDYGNGKVSMYIIKPGVNATLSQIVNALTPNVLANKVFQLPNNQDVILSIPTFNISYEDRLKNKLEALGVTDLFSMQADLSNMVKPKTGGQELYVDEIYHKARLQVNEEGAIASAASAAVIMAKSFPITHKFVLDKPFLFLIAEKTHNDILFMGSFSGNY